MTATDWIVDCLLLLVVLRQVTWTRIDVKFVVVPLAITGYFAAKYLGTIPTGGNDLVLVGIFTAAGLVLGVLGGLFTRLRRSDGVYFVRAGVVSASLWIVSVGARMAFAAWTSHSSGARAIGRFSERHDITSSQAWVASLLLMIICEVASRMATIVLRARLTRRADDSHGTGEELTSHADRVHHQAHQEA